MQDESKIIKTKPQNIVIENKKKLNLTGVTEVISFDDETIIVETTLGILIIRGLNLHISKLSIEQSELNVDGEIISCEYDESDTSKGKTFGVFSKLFRNS